MGGREPGDPRAKSFVDGIAESTSSGLNGNDLCTEELHPEDIESLAADIFGTHVDSTLKTELGTDGGSGDTVLPSTSLSNDLGLAEAASKKHLTECIVDLMRAGVVEIFTLEPDLGSTAMLGETVGVLKVTRTAHEGIVRLVLLPESEIVLGLDEAGFELGKTIHQRLGDILATEFTKPVGNSLEVNLSIWACGRARGMHTLGLRSPSAFRASI